MHLNLTDYEKKKSGIKKLSFNFDCMYDFVLITFFFSPHLIDGREP